jgi:hypothetical protein
MEDEDSKLGKLQKTDKKQIARKNPRNELYYTAKRPRNYKS